MAIRSTARPEDARSIEGHSPDLSLPSNGTASTGEPTPESKLASVKEGERIEGVMVRVFCVYLTEGVGNLEKKIEKSAHTTRDEALVAAHKADSGGKDGKIESKLVIQHDDGRYLNSDGTIVRVGLDQQYIAKLRAELFGARPEVEQVLFSRYNQAGQHVSATTSES